MERRAVGEHAGPERRLLSGWGGQPRSTAEVVRPRCAHEVVDLLAAAEPERRPVLARGLGRSYGDAACNGGGIVVDMTGLDRFVGFDAESRYVTVEAGVSLDALISWAVPRGWFVPVTPGTRQVTVGGAVAADVHGKNHHRDGALGSWVRRLRLATPVGEACLSPQRDPEAFWATVGGMGLTGVVIEATIELIPIESSLVRVDTERAEGLEECMRLMEEGDASYRYSVAWLNCVRSGPSLGRAVLTRGDHATLADLRAAPGRAPRRGDPLGYRARELATVPFEAPVRLPSLSAVRAFNELWYRRAPRRRHGELQTIPAFFHPLDVLGEWRRLYGRAGFTQYQVVVPFGAEEVVREIIEVLLAGGFPSLFAVLKRFGGADPAPLSFPRPGWTLALDIPLGSAGLGAILDRLDERVASAGGRVYFAKDSRLRPDLVGDMYPRLAEWRAVRDRLDPGRVLASDLGRRLHLLEEAA
jgi:decaprenylphospho-beta-D-ribofuranose 2-oxidase